MSAPALKLKAPEDVVSLAVDPVDDVTRAQAADIIAQVRAGGEDALRALSMKFGDLKEGQPYVLGRPEMKAAFDALPEVRAVVGLVWWWGGLTATCVGVCVLCVCVCTRLGKVLQDQQALLRRVAGRVRTFAEAQRGSIGDVSIPVPGGTAGHSVRCCPLSDHLPARLHALP